MNNNEKQEVLKSYFIQVSCPRYLEFFTIFYYSALLTIFFYALFISDLSKKIESNFCEIMYTWNLACLFYFLLSLLLTFVLKWLRKTLNIPVQKLIAFRIIIGLIASTTLILGIGLNINEISELKCNSFELFDTIFIISESIVSFGFFTALIYTIFYYYIFSPKREEPKKVIKSEEPKEKNFELLPISSF